MDAKEAESLPGILELSRGLLETVEAMAETQRCSAEASGKSVFEALQRSRLRGRIHDLRWQGATDSEIVEALMADPPTVVL